MSRIEDAREGNARTFKFTPATSTSLALALRFGTELPADATAFHVTGYGIYFAAGAINTGAMLVTQANTSTDPQPGSLYMGPGVGNTRHEEFGEDGVRLAASDGDITFTYTHGANVALGGWVKGYWVR